MRNAHHHILVLFLILFLASLGTLVAAAPDIYLGGGKFSGFYVSPAATAPVDPCAGKNIGDPGTGTPALCAGTGYTGEVATPMDPTVKYMAMPGGCDGTTNNPTCSGVDDPVKVRRMWATNTGAAPKAYGVLTGASSTVEGANNTTLLATMIVSGYATAYTDTAAAQYCENMVYGGYNNWYLPAQDELNFVLHNNMAAIKGFAAVYYWSSSEYTEFYASTKYFVAYGVQGWGTKTDERSVRCIRRY